MKGFIYALWVIIVVILVAQINVYSNRLDAAREYIHELEEDFPQHLDITSGSDAYNNWYCY